MAYTITFHILCEGLFEKSGFQPLTTCSHEQIAVILHTRPGPDFSALFPKGELIIGTALIIACHVRFNHLCGIDDAVELGIRNKAKFQRSSLQSEVVVHGIVRYFRRLIIANNW